MAFFVFAESTISRPTTILWNDDDFYCLEFLVGHRRNWAKKGVRTMSSARNDKIRAWRMPNCFSTIVWSIGMQRGQFDPACHRLGNRGAMYSGWSMQINPSITFTQLGSPELKFHILMVPSTELVAYIQPRCYQSTSMLYRCNEADAEKERRDRKRTR